MRTKEQIDYDMEDGNFNYTHEEWHMYNNIPKKGCVQCEMEGDTK